MEDSHVGIGPEKLLLERFKILSFFRLAIHGGMWPLSLHSARDRNCRFWKPVRCIRPSSLRAVSPWKQAPSNKTARLSQRARMLRAPAMFDRLL